MQMIAALQSLLKSMKRVRGVIVTQMLSGQSKKQTLTFCVWRKV